MEKTIKYLENGEYHYATVRSVGDLAQLKTTSKETLVEAINELWNGGGNVDPSKVPNPEGYDKLVQDVADAVKNQQETNQQWIEWKKEEAQLTEERKQAYLQAMKEMQEAIDKAKADAAALGDKTAKLDEQITKTFSDLDTNIQNMHEQLQKEADRMNQELQDTKGALSTLRTDLQNAQLDNGKIHDELTNINGKFEHKVWQTDLDPLKAQIDRAETSVQQTKDELLGKASREDLDTVTNAVSKLDTQLKETAKGVEISVKKDELGGDVARLLNDKTNLLLGTRSFSGEDNWRNRDKVTIEPGYYKGMKTAAVQVTDASIYQPYRVKANTAYTFSFFGKEDRDNPKATLVIKPIDAQNVNVDGGEQQVHITTEWQRFAVTFSVDQECEISIQIIQGPEATNNILHLAGLKLQYGQNDTPWEPNEADVAENIEHTESQFNVYSDQIAGIVKKQEKMGDTERQLDTRITETAEGLKQTSKDLQDANGKITEFKGQLESTAHGLKTEYEKYTNDTIGQISDSTLNLIRNSSFQNKDEDFDQWQNVSAKANVRQDENGLRWVELTQSGMTTDNIVGLTSNYFKVKQGKVTVAVDIKSGTKADLDVESVLTLELYDENKKRVDFTRLTLNDLGLNKSLLGDHQVHRGLHRLGIDRNDAKYMTVKALLARNGDLYFTNFSARLSSIDDGAYEPNPDDLNQQILKQNTKIEQNAKEVAIKANSVDVTRDIKSAVDGVQVGGVNLANNTGKPFTMGYCIPNTTWKDNSAYLKLPTTVTGGEILPQGDNTFQLLLEKGKTYTQTIWVETDANVKDLNALQFTWFTFDGHDFQPARVKKIGDKLYKLYSTYTWPGKKDNNVRLFDTTWLGNVFNLTSSGSYLKFLHPQIEYGNQSTDWSQSPEDISTEIKSAKDAAIQVASGQINLHVNELSTQFDDRLNKRINEQKTASEKFTSDGIKQVVTKITNVKGDVDRLGDRVNGIQVGGRNLVTGTEQDVVIDDTSNTQDKGWRFEIIHLTQQPKLGDQITVSAESTLTGKGDLNKYYAVLYNETTTNQRSTSATLIPGKRSKGTLTVNFLGGVGETVLLIYAGMPEQTAGKKNVVHHLKVEFGNQATDWTLAPEDLDKKIDTQTLDTANIDEMRTQGHYFVRNLTGNPIGGWVYVDVTGNNNDRVRQDVYADQNNQHKYRSWNGSRWSDWEQGAYLSDVNNVKTEVTASVNNLGDRVTTQVNSITTRMSDQIANAVELIQKSDFSDGSKGSWTVQSIISATNPAPPAELGISGMKVIQSNVRDSYEDVWHSVTPGEKFNVDFWCAPSGVYDSSFGLVFYDANKKLVPNNQWLGVRTDHSGQWRHYTGEITAPGNSAFAKPWFQIDMPADQHNTSWLAKPHIRRQDPRVTEAIKEVNTKWDVANGQIQGKVTETQVNNILNGKGYATQSWAETMFQMKKNSITLQAVRDNITNGIQNQLNSTNDRINDTNNRLNNLKIGGTNLLRGTSDTPRRLQGSGYLCKTTASDIYTSTADFHGGDQFTYSATITNNSNHPVSLEMWLFNGREKGHTASNINSHSEIVPAHTQNKRVSATITITSDTWWVRTYVIYSDGHGVDGETVDVSNEKLEVGNVATDWSPNPNDTGNGVNVLRGTADFSWPTGIGTNGTVNLGYEKFDATTIQLHVWGNNGGIYTKWGEAFPDGQIQVGEQYVFSFDIKGNGTFSSVKNESESLNIASGVPVTNTYQRVKVVGTIKSLDKAFIIYFQGDYDVRIKNVKIERGSKATPWTPHPFDDKDKGVNLLKSTAYWNPNDWNHISDGYWYDDNWTDNLGHKAYGRSNAAWNGLGQTVYVTPGVYTWSAQIYLNGLDSNDSVYPYMGDSQYNGTAQVQEIRRPMLGVNDQNRWIDYSTTFYVKNAGNLCVRPELNRNHGTIHVGSQKLEHGMVATPWSPSPLDDKNATITLNSADVNNMKTQGHYFVRNLAGNPIGGWVYVDVSGNNNDRLKQEVYQDNGYEHRSRRWTGSGWTEWTTDVNNKNVVSQINITPDQIKIASNKIVIDGNTDIHGTLRVPDVKLAGRNGNVDLSGDGINITKTNGAGINIANNGIQLTANTNGQNEVEGVLTTAWSMNNKNQNGIGLVITPEQTLGRPYGGDILTIGSMAAPGTIHAGMVFDATGINPDYRRGFNWFAPHTLSGDGGVLRFPGAQDDLMLYPGNMPGSRQSDYSQPTLRLVHGNSQGSAGIQFQWNDIVPFGRITSSMSYVSAVGTDDDGGITVSWYSYGAWYGGRKAPSIVYRGSDGNRGNGGIVFYPYGEVCFWQGDFHSNLRWSGMKNTD
ncbi:phage specificity protein [Limosilactobacillus reuteri subsp. suis]|uniref:phage specificity protein n=1 Tax=Limosilactobacillus reuteri TaxID=1598 RepID=UPI0039910EDA